MEMDIEKELINPENDAEQAWIRLNELLQQLQEQELHGPLAKCSRLDHLQLIERFNATEKALQDSQQRVEDMQRELNEVRLNLNGDSEQRLQLANDKLEKLGRKSPTGDADVDNSHSENTTALLEKTGEINGSEMLSATGAELEGIVQRVECHLQAMSTAAAATAMQEDSDDVIRELSRLQQMSEEFDKIKSEMERMMGKYDQQREKYTQKEQAMKAKFYRFREQAKKEKLKYDERVDRLEAELLLARSTLRKETKFRTAIERRNQKLLDEQRDLQSRLTEQERIQQARASQLASLAIHAGTLLQQQNITSTENSLLLC